MTINELRIIIENEGLRTGFDMETNKLVILSKGFMKLGEIDWTNQFDVHLNGHFKRQVPKHSEINIYKAIFAFVETPIEKRDEEAVPNDK